MAMHNPPHPGEILREDVLPALGNGGRVGVIAAHLGVSRPHFSKVLHGRKSITTDLAWRLEQAGLSTASTWLQLQAAYDLWQLSQQPPAQIARLPAVA